MTPKHNIIILLLFIISVANSQWVTIYEPPLPRHSTGMAAGSYNGSIFILGGDSYSQQLLEYNNDIWIDHGMYALPTRTYGSSDYYTQINDSLYMISTYGITLNVYNMDTNIFITDWINVTNIYGGCITSNHNTLFMGGYYTVSVLLLDTMEWLKNVSNMQTRRSQHSCNIDPETHSLYAIGGKYSDSVEMINIDNIIEHSWHILEDTLSSSMPGVRSIWVKNKIYVFGGNVINIINPKTQSITVSTEPLPFHGYKCAVTAMDNIIYLFNYYQYWAMNIDITSVTNTPTNTPTKYPTFDPGYSQWVTIYDPPLPRYSNNMAVGSYNGSIFILGGRSDSQKLLEYRNDSWIDHGINALPSVTYNRGDYYTQINDLLFMISGSTLNVYNMETNVFISDWIRLDDTYKRYSANDACITSTHNTIFILGGYDSMRYYDSGYTTNRVSVLLVDTMEWLNEVPSMEIVRYSHSCNIDPETHSLYAIGGGSSYGDDFSSVEMINTDNIIQETWHILEDTLSIAKVYRNNAGLRSIWINNQIYVFWGYEFEVNVINTKTQSITIADTLHINIGGMYCAVTAMDNIIYLFNDKEYWVMNDLTVLSIQKYQNDSSNSSMEIIAIVDIDIEGNEYAVLDNDTLVILCIVGSAVVICLITFVTIYFKIFKHKNNNKNEMEAIKEMNENNELTETNQEREGKHGVCIEEMVNINVEMHEMNRE